MTPTAWVLGTDADVLGFGLAGVDGEVCSSARDVRRAFTAIDRITPPPALVLVSSDVAKLHPELIAERTARVRGPIVVVLP